MMKRDYKFIDKGIYLEKERILVIADLHLGYEEYLVEQGMFLPKFQYKKIIEDLKNIFSVLEKEKREVKEIIILGDLKHEFGRISKEEWRDVLNLLDFLLKKCKVTLVKGNHDTILEPIAGKKDLKIKNFYVRNENLFAHGDKKVKEIENKKIKRIFLGHMHPAISIVKGVKKEIYKCFLVGKFKGKEVVILPSFFPLVEGSDVTIENTNLAFKLNLSGFEVCAPVPGEILRLGKLREVGRLV